MDLRCQVGNCKFSVYLFGDGLTDTDSLGGEREEGEEGSPDKGKDDEVKFEASGWAFNGENNSFLLAFIIASLSSDNQAVGIGVRDGVGCRVRSPPRVCLEPLHY